MVETNRMRRIAAFAQRVLVRFIDDRCLPGAGALSYATIVSLVPLIAIAFAVFSGFPIFAPLRARLLGSVMANFAPEIGAESAAMLTSFADNAASTTAVGVLALVVSAVLVLATIEEHLHHIFRVTTPRSWGMRILAYWTVLTLGPLALGAVLTMSGDINGLIVRLGFDGPAVIQSARDWSGRFQWLLTFMMTTATFTLLYRLIPNRKVAWRPSLYGGLLAAAILELLNIGFSIYLAGIASYNAVYGALAGIPILLLWMYIFWGSVLLGAEFAACLAEGDTPP
jgi:membrane protein